MDAPELPGHIVTDEIWRWLEPRRTRFDRVVHKFYGRIGTAVVRLLPGHRDPLDKEAQYVEAEQGQLNRALEEIYTKLELVESTATSVVRRELVPILTGDERERAFNELRERLAATPLLTDAYRQSIASELEKFQATNPGMMRAIEWGLVATAVIRPAITLCMFGAADLAAHTALHVGAHSMAQIFVDLAAGTAVTVGGEGTIAGLGSPAKRLLADLFTKFYEERAALLARMIHDCVLGRHLDRINRLARIHEREDYKKVDLIRGELTLQLSAMEGSDQASCAPVPAAT
jgi:hypothetical protein